MSVNGVKNTIKDKIKDKPKDVVKDAPKVEGVVEEKVKLPPIDPETFKKMEEEYPVGVSVATNCWRCHGPTSYDVTVAGVICDCILEK